MVGFCLRLQFILTGYAAVILLHHSALISISADPFFLCAAVKPCPLPTRQWLKSIHHWKLVSSVLVWHTSVHLRDVVKHSRKFGNSKSTNMYIRERWLAIKSDRSTDRGDWQAMQRPYKCTFAGCDKSYRRSTHLSQHMRTHMPEKLKDLTCPECNKAFATRQRLNVHMELHQRPTPYEVTSWLVWTKRVSILTFVSSALGKDARNHLARNTSFENTCAHTLAKSHIYAKNAARASIHGRNSRNIPWRIQTKCVISVDSLNVLQNSQSGPSYDTTSPLITRKYARSVERYTSARHSWKLITNYGILLANSYHAIGKDVIVSLIPYV